jgi:hypothetical protein
MVYKLYYLQAISSNPFFFGRNRDKNRGQAWAMPAPAEKGGAIKKLFGQGYR